MELRQLRYFLKVVELGSMGRAAVDLDVVASTLSQQISRLESELSTRLLTRTSTGVVPTDAGVAFMRQAQLSVRHADDAVHAAQQARLAGQVSIGLAPTTATVLGYPLMLAMRQRYPDVRLHLVESLSGHLATMLNTRQLDLAVLFRTDAASRWSVMPLLQERLFLMGSVALMSPLQNKSVRLADLGTLPLILPSEAHGLRDLVAQAFARARARPNVVAEVDGLGLLMSAVRSGAGATIQPGAAANPLDTGIVTRPIADRLTRRTNFLASLSNDELSPAALAARLVILDVTRAIVLDNQWPGATLHEE